MIIQIARTPKSFNRVKISCRRNHIMFFSKNITKMVGKYCVVMFMSRKPKTSYAETLTLSEYDV